MKADLAIYSQAVDVRGWCPSESLKVGHNLDFSSCDIMVGFHKSSHIRMYNYVAKTPFIYFLVAHILGVLMESGSVRPGYSVITIASFLFFSPLCIS